MTTSTLHPPSLLTDLRGVLRLDSVATAAVGVLAVAGAVALDDLLGLPAAVLIPVGLFLLAYAAGVWAVAARPRVSRGAATAVAVLNVAWVVASVVTAALGDLTALGVGVVLAQAVAVAGFAALQLVAVRRCP